MDEFIASTAVDAPIEFHPNHSSKTQCNNLGLSHEPFLLRVLKIALPAGETEILFTTLLDAQRYPHEDFYDLYGRRWGIEVDYQFKKHKHEIENFTGLSVHAIKQDMAAKVLTHNIAMAAACCAQQHRLAA